MHSSERGQDARRFQVIGEASDPRGHEDSNARGMENRSILQTILAKMLRELRGNLWALENMKTSIE